MTNYAAARLAARARAAGERRRHARRQSLALLALALAVLFLAYVTAAGARAAEPDRLCAMWAREAIRVCVAGGVRQCTPASADAIMLWYQTAKAYCEKHQPAVVDVNREPAGSFDAWVAATLRGAPEAQGTVPAAGASGFPSGSPEWIAWCRAEYRSFDPATGTVVRRGQRGKRVPCPG